MRTSLGKLSAAALAVAFIYGGALQAQNVAGNPPTGANADQRGKVQVAVAHDFRSSQIIGMAVRNGNNEKIGKIDDLVIDLKSGDIRYAALSFGGFAGIGSKLFAVPFEAMTFKFGDPNNVNDRWFVFDVTKDQLEKAPGFDSSHWPNVADSQWSTSIDKHYKIERHATATSNKETGPLAFETVFRASKIKGLKVRNNKNDNLGSIDELVIEITKGKVKYAVLSYGSTLGVGGKLFAVPLSAMTLSHGQNETHFVIHVNEDALRNAPGFDRDHWPNTADPNWATDVDRYYQRTAQRPTTR